MDPLTRAAAAAGGLVAAAAAAALGSLCSSRFVEASQQEATVRVPCSTDVLADWDLSTPWFSAVAHTLLATVASALFILIGIAGQCSIGPAALWAQHAL